MWVPYVLQAVKNMSEQSQVEQLTDILSHSSIRPLLLRPRWTWETSSLTNLNITHPYSRPWNDNSDPGRAKTILLNTVWYNLLADQPTKSRPDIFLRHKEDHTYDTQNAGTLCTLWCHRRCTRPARIMTIRHQTKHTPVVPNQTDCSPLKRAVFVWGPNLTRG